MGQFNEDLELVADLLGAGIDVSSAYSMYRDFLGDKGARQDTKQAGLQGLLASAADYAGAGTRRGGTKAALETLGPSFGFPQGAQAPALNEGLKALYPGGQKVSPLFTPPQGEGGMGGKGESLWGATSEERVKSLVSEAIANYPGAAEEGNRDIVREFVSQDFQAILSPKDYKRIKPDLDAAIDRNYATSFGTQQGLSLEEVNELRDTTATQRASKPHPQFTQSRERRRSRY